MGGRPRKPTKLLLLNGAARHNPKRFLGRLGEPEPEPGLGPAPEHFSPKQVACWGELQEMIPPGVLTRMDRPGAELLCKLWAQSRAGEGTAAHERLLASLFGKFGLTPSERSKVPGALPEDKRPPNLFADLEPAKRAAAERKLGRHRKPSKNQGS